MILNSKNFADVKGAQTVIWRTTPVKTIQNLQKPWYKICKKNCNQKRFQEVDDMNIVTGSIPSVSTFCNSG